MQPAQGQDVSSETTEQQYEDSLKLVPVSESIRYRKRAQSAEKQVEMLAEQLSQAKAEAVQMSGQLNEIKCDQELAGKLTAAGVVDLETALLLSKARIAKSENLSPEECVGQLKKEKQYLFATAEANSSGALKTAGAKERIVSSQSILEKAACRAAETGSRADLQEYLKLRRNFI